MKKTLILIRHAKSSWSNADLSDHDRPLNKRGKRDAPFMGSRLLGKGLLPDLFLSSTAKRAKSTAKKVAKQIGYPKGKIVYDSSLYLADHKELLERVRLLSEEYATVFLVGHNYGITDFAESLSGESLNNIPTAGIVGLEFKRQWSELQERDCSMVFFEFPKLFTSER